MLYEIKIILEYVSNTIKDINYIALVESLPLTTIYNIKKLMVLNTIDGNHKLLNYNILILVNFTIFL